MLIIALICQLKGSIAVELTFELPDSAKQCFHEDVKAGTKCTLEFQVVTGGHYDVDCVLENPQGQPIYQGIKKQFDSHTFTADKHGVYTVCFSNEFSTFSHKLVYMDFQVGEEQPLPGVGEHLTAMTKLEQSSANIHDSLNKVLDDQTHYRLREAQGRKRAEDLNSRVMWWSISESVAVLVITIGQVLILRNFFSDRKTIPTS